MRKRAEFLALVQIENSTKYEYRLNCGKEECVVEDVSAQSHLPEELVTFKLSSPSASFRNLLILTRF